MSFINDKFMLKNKTAEKIYEKIKGLPIIDYHCHLDPKMIAEDYRFKSASTILGVRMQAEQSRVGNVLSS